MANNVLISFTADTGGIDEANKKIEELKNNVKELIEKSNSLGNNSLFNSKDIQSSAKATQDYKKEFQDLRKEIDQTKSSIADVAKAQRDLQKTVEVNAINQAYAKLENELTKVKEEIKNVGKEGENTFTILKGGLAVLVGDLMKSAIDNISRLVKEGIEWVKTGIDIAASSEGIKRAFDALNNPGLLNDLRSSTKGLVTDLELMKTAVKAQNYQIPLEKLGNLLKFAQQRASETGESVDYLVESIVTGLGRKSPLILDNLQISTIELNKRVKEGGDFMTASIDLINEKLQQQGDLAEIAGDAKVRNEVKWQNAQIKTGEKLLFIREIWDKLSGNIVDGVSTYLEDYIPKIISGLERVINFFIKIYNSVDGVRSAIQVLWGVLNTFFDVVMTGLKNLLASFDLLATTIEAALDWDLDGVRKGWDNFEAAISRNNKNLVNNLKSNWEGVANDINKELSEINLNPEPKKPILGKKRLVIVDEEKTKETNTPKKIKNTGNTNALKKQQKELNDLEKKLQSDHLAEMKRIREGYLNGEIQSEAEYNSKLYNQEQAFSKKREESLRSLYGKITNEEVRSDIIEKIAEIQNKRLSQEIEFRKKQEKIILDADPVAKEINSYREKLATIGIYNREEQILTEEQQEALEVLEKQHQDNLKKIKDDAAKKERDSKNKEFKKNLDERIIQTKKEYADGIISRRKYDNDIRKITIESLQAEIDDRKKHGEDIIDIEKQLADERIKIAEEEAEARAAIQEELFNTISVFSDSYFSGQQQRIQQELDDLNHYYTTDIEEAKNNKDKKLISEQEYQQKQLQLKRKQAQSEKDEALFNLALTSGQAIARAFKDYPFPASAVIAALVAVQTLKQMNDIRSRPLPKYWKGRKDGKGEFALVGEQGAELMYIPQGASIMPAHDSRRALNGDTSVMSKWNMPSINPDYKVNPGISQSIVNEYKRNAKSDIDYDKLGRSVAKYQKVAPASNFSLSIDKSGIKITNGNSTTNRIKR